MALNLGKTAHPRSEGERFPRSCDSISHEAQALSQNSCPFELKGDLLLLRLLVTFIQNSVKWYSWSRAADCPATSFVLLCWYSNNMNIATTRNPKLSWWPTISRAELTHKPKNILHFEIQLNSFAFIKGFAWDFCKIQGQFQVEG